MTPKEKALKLYDTFYYLMPVFTEWEKKHESAKLCSKQAVSEIQDYAQVLMDEYEGYPSTYEYFKQVLIELEKLP